MNKLLFKSQTSLFKTPIELRTKNGTSYIAIEAFEEHRAWGEKRFPGDDRDYSIEQIPVEITWEIQDESLVKKVKLINDLEAPLILFSYNGLKPKILNDLEVVSGQELVNIPNDWKIFPFNPVEERLQRLEEDLGDGELEI